MEHLIMWQPIRGINVLLTELPPPIEHTDPLQLYIQASFWHQSQFFVLFMFYGFSNLMNAHNTNIKKAQPNFFTREVVTVSGM
jgi:hypothetical protein